MLTGEIFCTFFLFYNFWRCLFSQFSDSKDYHVLRLAKKVFLFFFLFSHYFLLKILFLASFSLTFLFLLYAIIGLSWNTFFSLGLICNKCQYLSITFSMFGKVLLNFSTSAILGLFAIFGFEVNNVNFRVNYLVRKFCLWPRLINSSFNLPKCLLNSYVSE